MAKALRKVGVVWTVSARALMSRLPILVPFAQDGISSHRSMASSRAPEAVGAFRASSTGCVRAMLYRGFRPAAADALNRSPKTRAGVVHAKRPHMGG